MKKQSMSNDLKQTKEHPIYKDYASEERAILKAIDLKAGKHFTMEKLEHPTLVFLLSGEMILSMPPVVGQKVNGRQLFLAPTGSNFYGETITDLSIFICSFDRNMDLRNRFPIEQLQKHVKPDTQRENKQLTLLPIHDLLFRELEVTRESVYAGLSCMHYQHFKKEIIFIKLRTFYDKERLAALFAPILGLDNDFKDRVLRLYSQIETAQELMDRLNMSPTVFKRKFRESFGNSARQWLIQKKKENVFRDIVMTHITIAELADKYRFTVNYMTTFCQKHFGKSPTQLRSDWNNHSEIEGPTVTNKDIC